MEYPLTPRIIATASLTFACYFLIGLQLAVVPVFVHWHLGYSPAVAGIAVSAQYAATLLSRPVVGRLCDAVGGKRTTAASLLICAASGALFFASMFLPAGRAGSLGLLLVCRLVLGLGESGVATGATLWGMSRVGAPPRPVGLSGRGGGRWGPGAAGAPLGAFLENRFGAYSVGLVSVAAAGAGFLWSLTLRGVPGVASAGARTPLGRVFARVLPYGMSLALAGVGFGTIASFISLYYAQRHWPNAGLTLSVFGLAFVATRLLFSRSIDRWDGYRVALVSLAFEGAGLLVLWMAATPPLALAGAALAGMGFSLVFPALGVEAVRQFPVHSRGAALGVYSAFVDLSLGVSGPAAGLIAGAAGYPPIFLFAATLAFCSLALCAALYRRRGVPATASADGGVAARH